MKRVAVWPAGGRGVAQGAGEEVAGHVAHTDGGGAGADGGEACADELTHLCDIAFHCPFSLRWKLDFLSARGLAPQ
jgi:hypothetical protein